MWGEEHRDPEELQCMWLQAHQSYFKNYVEIDLGTLQDDIEISELCEISEDDFINLYPMFTQKKRYFNGCSDELRELLLYECLLDGELFLEDYDYTSSDIDINYEL